MDKLNAFWRKVLLSDKTKVELFGPSDKRCLEELKVRCSNLTTPYELSSMVAVASCSVAVLMPAVLVL